MTKHTPKIKKAYYWSTVTEGECDENEAAFCVEFEEWDDTVSQMHKLSYLFEAAPELLEAAEELVEGKCLQDRPGGILSDGIAAKNWDKVRKLRKAIEKARG